MSRFIVLFILTYSTSSFAAEKDKFEDIQVVKTAIPAQITVCSCNTPVKTDWKVANALR